MRSIDPLAQNPLDLLDQALKAPAKKPDDMLREQRRAEVEASERLRDDLGRKIDGLAKKDDIPGVLAMLASPEYRKAFNHLRWPHVKVSLRMARAILKAHPSSDMLYSALIADRQLGLASPEVRKAIMRSIPRMGGANDTESNLYFLYLVGLNRPHAGPECANAYRAVRKEVTALGRTDLRTLLDREAILALRRNLKDQDFVAIARESARALPLSALKLAHAELIFWGAHLGARKSAGLRAIVECIEIRADRGREDPDDANPMFLIHAQSTYSQVLRLHARTDAHAALEATIRAIEEVSPGGAADIFARHADLAMLAPEVAVREISRRRATDSTWFLTEGRNLAESLIFSVLLQHKPNAKARTLLREMLSEGFRASASASAWNHVTAERRAAYDSAVMQIDATNSMLSKLRNKEPENRSARPSR